MVTTQRPIKAAFEKRLADGIKHLKQVDSTQTEKRLGKAELRLADSQSKRDDFISELDEVNQRIADAIIAGEKITGLERKANTLTTKITAIESRLPALQAAVDDADKEHRIELWNEDCVRFTQLATKRDLLKHRHNRLVAEFEAEVVRLRRGYNLSVLEASTAAHALQQKANTMRDSGRYTVAELESMSETQRVATNAITTETKAQVAKDATA